MGYPEELRPLDVTDDRQTERGEPIAEGQLEIWAREHVGNPREDRGQRNVKPVSVTSETLPP